MGNIVDLFPDKKSFELSDTKLSREELLEYWRGRNNIISDEFVKFNAYEKQQTLDTVLEINFDLYSLVLKLKERLGE